MMNYSRMISLITIIYRARKPNKLLDLILKLSNEETEMLFPVTELDGIHIDEAIHNSHEREDFMMRDLLLLLSTPSGQNTNRYNQKVYTDPITLEEIPEERLFKIKEGEHIFIFDIWSLKRLVLRDTDARNPLTRKRIPYDIKIQILNREPQLENDELEELFQDPRLRNRWNSTIRNSSEYISRVNSLFSSDYIYYS